MLSYDEEPMDTSDTPWYWFYKAECGMWHRIEDDPGKYLDSSYLDRYYLKNPQGVLEINTAAGDITIDFSGQTQTNLRTGQKQRITRSFSSCLDHSFRCTCAHEAPSLPSNWVTMDPKKPFLAVSLDLHSSEFKEVERYTKHHGLLQKHIKKIHRIQNVDLWEFYCRKKAQLMRIKGQSHIEEQRLFHGTSRDNVHSICKYNFECRLSDKRRHGCVYGKGTYFAKHASYADNYSVPDQQGFNKTQVMVLARVIVGEYKKGEDDFCKPDDDLKENLHDSCVDNPSHPTIYVIFDSNQIYPEYVLEY
ncbi:protein mono-ADP-ribosyltransferase PARP11-like [Electrophorus electricus]|uniref:protein mono-ADP-ribosyltransferase PARP11-like n=1 Tax=Electrophorus electricus TaxID=8005 RepID=UPI0015CFAA1D|nr:protein mono-ADP-ribosyltransferase PARP11-like [Electrophorus electricus]